MIWASLIFEGSELFYIPVLNPGSCEGKTAHTWPSNKPGMKP